MILGFRLRPILDSNKKDFGKKRKESVIFVQVPKYYKKALKIFLDHRTRYY